MKNNNMPNFFAAIIFSSIFIFIAGCSNQDADSFNVTPISQKVTEDGFRSIEERKFMNTHGFDELKTFLKYRDASITEKINISANNFSKKISGSFAVDCMIKMSLTKNYGEQNGTATPEGSNSLQIFINAYELTLNEMIKNGRFSQDEVKKQITEKMSLAIKYFEKSNDNKISTFKDSEKCHNTVTPYFAEPIISGYSYNQINPVSEANLTSVSQSNDTISKPALESVPGSAYATTNSEPFTPSFDCSKASNGQEKLVCTDRDLSKLDVQLAQAYAKARERSLDKESLKKEQLNWVKSNFRSCSDKACLTDAYNKRILELQ